MRRALGGERSSQSSEVLNQRPDPGHETGGGRRARGAPGPPPLKIRTGQVTARGPTLGGSAVVDESMRPVSYI